MTSEHSIQRYRHWYAKLLRLYPKPHHQRFGESMEQTFNDLCRECAGEERRLFAFALWMFVETSAGIIRENIVMRNKNIVRPALVTALILLVPLLANHRVEGWNWHWYSFVLAGALLFGAGLIYELVARKMSNKAYKFGAGLAVVAGLVLGWGTMIRVSESENLAYLMYYGVLAAGFIGALIARFEPRGLARILFAMAIVQMTIPVIALIFWSSDFAPDAASVFALNDAFFALLFVGSALLFRCAAQKQN